MKRAIVAAALLVLPMATFAQPESDEEYHNTRIGIAVGMGVNYHNAQDIVDRLNGSGIINRRVDNFKSAVEFFGAVSVPVNSDWAAKLEYVYWFSSYSLPLPAGFPIGSAEFSYLLHMPTLVGQYILYQARNYDFKVGLGFGFHFASYEEKFFNAKFTANGIGSLLELEGNTALGEDLFAHLGAQLRWEFVGELRDGAGRKPLATASTTLHLFSVGARLGMAYFF